MDQFSTASLITRSTNDIQQIQMVSVMLLRMVMYAPIIGIGGIIKVANTRTGLGWIIAVAVAAIVVVVGILMSVTMPKFKIMQTLVDRLNLVSREILTGLPVIRAFSRGEIRGKKICRSKSGPEINAAVHEPHYDIYDAGNDADHELHYCSDCVGRRQGH